MSNACCARVCRPGRRVDARGQCRESVTASVRCNRAVFAVDVIEIRMKSDPVGGIVGFGPVGILLGLGQIAR
jgi:hypothetical protein